MVKAAKTVKKSSQQKKQTKICFLITPIGESDSAVRSRVDQWNTLVYKEAFKGKNYKIIRADKIATPGIITKQILELIIKADLVIIDLTDLNTNVMYEAAIRHMIAKPHIQISPVGQRFPFDIKDIRAISYDPMDLEYPKKLSKDLRKSITETEKPKYKAPEILSEKFDLEKIFDDPDKFVALLLKHLRPVIEKSKEGLVELAPTGSSGSASPTRNRILDAIKASGTAGFPSGYLGVSSYDTDGLKCPYCGSQSLSTLPGSAMSESRHTCQVCLKNFSTSGY